MDPYYTVNTLLVVFSMMIMLAAVSVNTGMDRKRKGMTRLLFAVISIAAVCEWAGKMLDGAPVQFIGLHKLVKLLELCAAPYIGLLCGKSLLWQPRWEKPIFCLFTAHALLELFSVFWGGVWYVDAQNIYHHGPYYGIYIAFYLFSIVYYLAQGMDAFHRYQQSGGGLILLVTGFLMVGIVISLQNNNVEVIWLVVAMAAIMLYKFYGDVLQQVDGLTELGNRWAFEDYLDRYRGTGAILYFDVDDFKRINDTYGHSIGDQCLCATARALRAVYGGSGRCFRLGGDEFCVVLRRNLTQVDALNEAFLQQRERSTSGLPLPVVSVGYVLFDTEEEPISKAVERADRAMYQVKHLHKTGKEASEAH